MAMTLEETCAEIARYRPLDAEEAAVQKAILEDIRRFPDILTRENGLVPLTASSLIVNKGCTHTLMAYHNIYRSWAWTGGHADGDADLAHVAEKEAMEETGIKTLIPIGDGIATMDILPVWGHWKRGSFVPSHLHISINYLFEGDENEPIAKKEDENSGVQWLPIESLKEYVSEAPMLPVYGKLLRRLAELS